MIATLGRAAPTLTVTLLLDALRQTLEFEQSMSKKFSAPVRHLNECNSMTVQLSTVSLADE